MARFGVDDRGISPTLLTANADVTNTAGAFTTTLNSQSAGTAVPLIASVQDARVMVVQGVLTIVIGAVAPSALIITLATTAGTALDTYTVEPGLLVALAELYVPIFLTAVAAATLFAGAGANPLVQVKPTGQATTTKAVGSRAIFTLAQPA